MVFEYMGLNDRIYRAGLFAKSAKDTFEQINIIAGGTTSAICPLLGINSDCNCRTNRFTQFTGNTSFLTIWITPERMQTTEARRHRGLFLGILHRDLPSKQVFSCQLKTFNQFP